MTVKGNVIEIKIIANKRKGVESKCGIQWHGISTRKRKILDKIN